MMMIITVHSYIVLIILCLGKYFPTPEVGIVPATIKDHVHVVLQGNSY